MVDTVAVLSDVHGVLPVLDAVLADPDVAAAERIVITGDLLAGPLPAQTLDRFDELGDRLILVRGNADTELAAIRDDPARAVPDPICTWAVTQLDDARIDRVARLPHPVRLDVQGFGPVLFCHGTPRDEDEVVLVDTRMQRWSEVFAELPADVRTICCGHTHMPFVRLVDRRLVINPGSIGMPYGRAGGNWALLSDGNVTLRHTAVDLAQVRDRIIADSDYPDVEAWVHSYLSDRISDADAIATFGPRDGRRL
jgi:putative phosphoesterase